MSVEGQFKTLAPSARPEFSSMQNNSGTGTGLYLVYTFVKELGAFLKPNLTMSKA